MSSLVPRPSRSHTNIIREIFYMHQKAYFAYNVCVRAGRSGNEATNVRVLINLGEGARCSYSFQCNIVGGVSIRSKYNTILITVYHCIGPIS